VRIEAVEPSAKQYETCPLAEFCSDSWTNYTGEDCPIRRLILMGELSVPAAQFIAREMQKFMDFKDSQATRNSSS